MKSCRFLLFLGIILLGGYPGLLRGVDGAAPQTSSSSTIENPGMPFGDRAVIEQNARRVLLVEEGDDGKRFEGPPEYRVSSRKQLLAALAEAQAGEVIFVEDDARIDLTGLRAIVIPAGVTLAGGRGMSRREKGGLLHVDAWSGALPLFNVSGEDVRITGIRLRGPGAEYTGEGITGARGIRAQNKVEIDHCELSDWSYAAIAIRQAPGRRAEIHHNHIHDCWGPLGYGVEVGQGEALVRDNVFERCRHAIAGVGQKGCSYEAWQNMVLSGRPGAHCFDMHSNWEQGDRWRILPFLYPAGSRISIHHNIFAWDQCYAIVIRGRPREYARIHSNWFAHSSAAQAVRQKYNRGNCRVEANYFGSRIDRAAFLER